MGEKINSKSLPYEGVSEEFGKPPVEDNNIRIIAKTVGYEIFRDKTRGEMIFFTTEYHPGNLRISLAGLEKMVADLKSAK